MNIIAQVIVAALLLAACTSRDQSISDRLAIEFEASDTAPIDLSRIGPLDWERFCVLGPYSMNEYAEQVLGFKWNVSDKSEIGTNDGINLLLFVKGQDVLAYAEHPRNKGDFLEFQPRCVSRANATVVRRLVTGGIQLVPH